jgi:drug/metabolite transporter (DMT)-like permease
VNPSAIAFALVTVLLNGGAQLLLRRAALSGAVPTSPLSLVRNMWFMAGIAAYGVSVLTWLFVLRKVPLSVAAPFIAVVYVLVPLASRLFFDDVVTPKMWVGMLLVVLGVTLVAQGAPRVAPASASERPSGD